ncbi:MAG: 5-oxoprolinase [Solirubrobacterales bacterium 70-9]|nr:MAG: 5-oxoprolinase [Solirubrobacterales bacterium 70-9]
MHVPQAGGRADESLDPIVVELIRNGLNSAAEQMKQALVRTSFSPIVYDVLDFAAALYDRDVNLMAQAPSLALFMGTMDACVESSVAAVGGVDALEAGDMIVTTDPYATGSHPQDGAIVMPIFVDRDLIGYAAIKAHWLDFGAKAPYCSDTIDVYQEGTIIPGVKLYRAGERDESIWRIIRANTRVPDFLSGDLNAQIVGVRTGAAAVGALVRRHGVEAFGAALQRIYETSEEHMRGALAAIADGRYVGRNQLDSDGVNEGTIPFEVSFEIRSDDCLVDFSAAPDAVGGPVNCPLPSTISAARLVLTLLAAGGEPPNAGHFRPIAVATRPGSIFDPRSPSPVYLYGWLAVQACEALLRGFGEAEPERAVASSGADLMALTWWGRREETGEYWLDGTPYPTGQGAAATGDGGINMHLIENSAQFESIEICEAKNPLRFERFELAPDSAGPGRQRGGLGIDMAIRFLADAETTVIVERTLEPPAGIAGGGPARPNDGNMEWPDGSREHVVKATNLKVPKGSCFHGTIAGGGGYGPPAERDLDAIHADLDGGYLTEEHVRTHYPQAAGLLDRR